MNAITTPPAVPTFHRKPDVHLWRMITRRCLWEFECELDMDEKFLLQTILTLRRISPAQWERVLEIAGRVMPNTLAEILYIALGGA